MQVLGLNLNTAYISVCNNATWAIGELSLQLCKDMQPHLRLVLSQLIENINRQVLYVWPLDRAGATPPSLPAEHSQDSAGEHGHHHRAAGAGVPGGGGSLPAPVPAHVVPDAAHHPRQRGKGLGFPGHLLHDQREPSGRAAALHVLLRCSGFLEHPARRPAGDLPQGELLAGRALAEVLVCVLHSQILHGFKNEVGEENWRAFADQFPPTLKEKLATTYQV